MVLQHLHDPGAHCAADGGTFVRGLSRYLDREPMLALFHEFFSPLGAPRKEKKRCLNEISEEPSYSWPECWPHLGAGWARGPRVINRTRIQPVAFSHQVHADKAGSKCDDCHSFRTEGADAGSFTGIPTLR